MGENHTKAVFDATASTYDRDRSLLIPGCDAFYRWAIDLIPRGAKTILDLGAGSGLLSVMIRERFPKARIHLVDFSEAMLDLARERMSGDANVTFQQADYLVDPLPKEMCAVVSSLSIHHLEDEGKREIFRRAYGVLKPNGVFVNAEQVAGPTAELDVRYKELWLAEVRAAGRVSSRSRIRCFGRRRIDVRQWRASLDGCGRRDLWMPTAGIRRGGSR
jgi:tRNA (cmo5U34)-methyltransferase